MRRPALAALASAAALALTTLALAPSAGAAPSSNGEVHRNVHVCDTPAAGSASCDAIRNDRVDGNGRIQSNATPAGYGPAEIESAYGLPVASTDLATAPSGPLVAIVDAYDDPNAASDLGVYRKQYNLPPCTTANGCFVKVNQNGASSPLPPANGGWAQEISLDLDMVSSACPGCRILLVEANSSSFANLAAGVTSAAQRGAKAISNSYGGTDTSDSTWGAYDHPGIAVTASTGDSGYGAQSPASFTGVVAVGGTSLTHVPSGSRQWTETAWSGAGSGCSTKNKKPVYQSSSSSCGLKADADVSAVADPNHGVAVYDSSAYQGASGWMVFGGTSASSPIIASVFAMGGVQADTEAGSLPWGHEVDRAGLNDVVNGSNGTCSTPVWCNSGSGWDGPTGLGTPNGTSAF